MRRLAPMSDLCTSTLTQRTRWVQTKCISAEKLQVQMHPSTLLHLAALYSGRGAGVLHDLQPFVSSHSPPRHRAMQGGSKYRSTWCAAAPTSSPTTCSPVPTATSPRNVPSTHFGSVTISGVSLSSGDTTPSSYVADQRSLYAASQRLLGGSLAAH